MPSKTTTVMTSSLPINITKERIYLTKGEKCAKLPCGPTSGVKPVPTPLMVPVTAPSAVTKSMPEKARTNVKNKI